MIFKRLLWVVLSLSMSERASASVTSLSTGFAVDESTGQASYRYSFALPAARGRFQPTLGLATQTPVDNGVFNCNQAATYFGRGWELSEPTLTRLAGKYALRVGSAFNRLVPSLRDGAGALSPEVETTYWKVVVQHPTATATDVSGNIYRFETFDPVTGDATYKLSSVTDPDGNVTRFKHDGPGHSLTQIAYNGFRPDSPSSTASVGDTGTYATTVDLEYGSDLNNVGIVLVGVVVRARGDATGLIGQGTTLRRYTVWQSGSITPAGKDATKTTLDSISLTGSEIAGDTTSSRTETTRFQPFGLAGLAQNCLGMVVTPRGATINISYASSEAFGDSGSAPYAVVSKIITSGPAIQTSAIQYWYEAPVRTSTDYLGFRNSWRRESTSLLTQKTTWNTSSRAFRGQATRIETGPQTNFTGDWMLRPLFTSARTKVFQQEARSISTGVCSATPTESSYPLIPINVTMEDSRLIDAVALASRTSTACSSVDQWGNAQQVITDPDIFVAGDEVSIKTTFLVTQDSTNSCKDCVDTMTRLSGTTTLEATWYEYSPTNLLKSIRRQTTTDQADRSTWPTMAAWEYYANGNLRVRSENGTRYEYIYDAYYQLRPASVQVFDMAGVPTSLRTDMAYDPVGRLMRVDGPYYVTTLANVPASSKPQRYLYYEPLGDLAIVAAAPITSGNTARALQAFVYADPTAFSLGSITKHVFSVASQYSYGASLPTSDVSAATTYFDCLGRPIQVRERLGGSGSGAAGAAIVHNLAQYRVSGSVIYDGAGRVTVSVGPYLSASSAYTDVRSSPIGGVGGDASRGPIQATFFAYDNVGRETCRTLRVLTTTVASAEPPLGVCTSVFSEDAAYALATRTIYRGLIDPLDSRHVLGTTTIEARFNAVGLSIGPETFTDASGLTRRAVDAHGNGLRYAFDPLGRPVAVVREAAGALKPAVTSSVSLDMAGRVVARSDPNFGERAYAYDPQMPTLVSTITLERLSKEIRYTYDKGRIASVAFCQLGAVGCTNESTIVWDLPFVPLDQPPDTAPRYFFTAGRVGYAFNANTTIAHSFDEHGYLARRDQWLPGVAGGFGSLFERRADGRPIQTGLTEPGLNEYSETTSYDSVGRPAQVSRNGGLLWSATNAPDNTGAYDAFDNLRAVVADEGRIAETWSYRASSTLLDSHEVRTPGAANPVVFSTGLFAYRGSQLTGFTDHLTQTKVEYWYNNVNQLVAARAKPVGASPLAQTSLTCIGFRADGSPSSLPGPSFGNIEVVREGPNADTQSDYAYSGSGVTVPTGPLAGPDAPTAIGSSNIGYDDYGRVADIANGSEVYQYDLLGRMVRIDRASGLGETIAYDPFGSPVTRTVGASTVHYVGVYATVSIASGVMAIDAHATVGGLRIASTRLGPNARTLFLFRDRLTSVVATVVNGGVPGARYSYSSHGAMEVRTGDEGDGASDIGFAGALRLSGDLLIMGARVYSPSLKMFMQPDPLQPHTYTYAGGDPVNRWDPTGLSDVPAEKQSCKDGCPVQYIDPNAVVTLDEVVVKLPPKMPTLVPAGLFPILGFDPRVLGLGGVIGGGFLHGADVGFTTVVDGKGNSGLLLTANYRAGPFAGAEGSAQVILSDVPNPESLGGVAVGGAVGTIKLLAGISGGVSLSPYDKPVNACGVSPDKGVARTLSGSAGFGIIFGAYASIGYSVYVPIYRNYSLVTPW